MSVIIREFEEADYPGITAAHNSVFPDYEETVEEVRYEDERRDPKCRQGRWVAQSGGVIIGYGTYGQSSSTYHPRKFWLDVLVRPEWQRRGAGSALFERLTEALAAFDPLRLKCGTREDMKGSVRFVERRGFREAMRMWESRLDVTAFDPAPYAGVEERVREQGIEVRTLRELESDPERNPKLFDLREAVEEDIPRSEPERISLDYDVWLGRLNTNPGLLPDGYFVAVHDGQYVGLSGLFKSQTSADLFTGLTGVRREYRRRGIATALKLRGIEYARARDCPVIRTWNASTNRPMLSINEPLGFMKQPAWVEYVREM